MTGEPQCENELPENEPVNAEYERLRMLYSAALERAEKAERLYAAASDQLAKANEERDAQRQRAERLEPHVKVLLRIAYLVDNDWPDDAYVIIEGSSTRITAGELRAAAAALAETGRE